MELENFVFPKGNQRSWSRDNLGILMLIHSTLTLTRHLVHLEDNPNRAWEIWPCLFLEICDFHAPTRKRKVRHNYAPWLTPEIKRLMFERDKLKRAAIINNSDAHWTVYKIA